MQELITTNLHKVKKEQKDDSIIGENINKYINENK